MSAKKASNQQTSKLQPIKEVFDNIVDDDGFEEGKDMMMTRLRLIRVEQVQRHSGSPAAAANLLMAAHDEDVVDKVIILNHDETYQRS